MIKTKQALTNFAEQLENKPLEIKGRSLWQDARRRFMRNKAAVLSLVVIGLITLFAIFGSYFSAFNYEDIDWVILSNPSELGKPSFNNGHYFGTDQLGRDLFARTVQGGQISLLVGVLSSSVAIVIGTLYGAT